MGNYLVVTILALTIAPIVFSVLLGLLRGSRRSLLRLILVVLCVVLAAVLCGAVANTASTIEVTADSGEVMTLSEYMQTVMGEDMGAAMSDFMVPLIQSIFKVISFLMLFYIFRFITWAIVYPICKIFIKPKRVTDSYGNTRKKKRGLIGAVFGLVQGVVVALCLCIVVNGFFTVGNDFVVAMDTISTISSEQGGSESGEPAEASEYEDEDGYYNEDDYDSDGEMSGEGMNTAEMRALFEGYNESALGKMYNAIGSKPFALLSQITKEDGTKITLTGQTEALRGLVDILKEFVGITELDFDNFYADDNISKLTTILENVQLVKDGLSEEAHTTVSGLINTLGESLGIDTDMLNKLMTADLSKEAQAFKKLEEYKNKDLSEITADDAKAIVESLGNSDLMLDMLAQQGGVDLGNGIEDRIDKIESALDSADLSAEKKDKLRDIFGLSNQVGDDEV